MPHIPSCLKKRLTVDDPSQQPAPLDPLSKPLDSTSKSDPKSASSGSKSAKMKPTEKESKEKTNENDGEKGNASETKKPKKEKKLKNLKSFFGPGKPKNASKPSSTKKTSDTKTDPDIVDFTGAEVTSKAAQDMSNEGDCKSVAVPDRIEADPDLNKDKDKEVDMMEVEVDEQQNVGSGKENRMLAKLSSYNSPGPRGHRASESVMKPRDSRSATKRAGVKGEAAGMDEKRKALWDKVETNPNAYYYRYKDPGEDVTKGKWRNEEKGVYLERLKKVGTEVGWGVFSQGIPGRVGYQCASFYRQLIESGDVKDDNYFINDKGKAVYKKPDKKTSVVKPPKASSLKKPLKRDPKAPAKPSTAYNLFAKKFCEETKGKQPDVPARELASLAGKAWGELPEDEKKRFQEESEADKRRYEEEMAKYTPSEGYDATGKLVIAEEVAKEKWTDSRVAMLASCVLEAHSQSAGTIVSRFKSKLAEAKISKKDIAEKLHSIGVKEKRAPDSKQIWYLRKECEKLADEASKKAHAEYRATIAVKTKPKFDFSGDKRHSKYTRMLDDYKEVAQTKLAETQCLIEKVKVHKWIEKRKGEPLQESVDDKDEIDLIIKCVQGSRMSREALVDDIFSKFPRDVITKQAIEDRVILCAERKYYGSNKKAEQLADAEFFVWEADNLNKFTKGEAKAIQQRRKELSRLCTHLKCVERILHLIETNVDSKNAQRIVNEENKVIKFIREEESRRQKAKEMSQQRQKAQPKVTLNSFFVKKSASPSTSRKSSTDAKAPSKPAEVVIIANEEDTIDKAIAEGSIKEPLRLKRYQTVARKQVSRDVECLTVDGKLEDSDVCKHVKKKLFQFYEDTRPAYFGTWRKQSAVVSGRRPFSCDPNVTDYSYDSGEDWEEPEDGESLASDREDEEEAEEMDKLDYKDGWLAGDGEFDYVDGEEGDHGVASEQLRERYSVGVVFSISTSKLPKARNLLRYAIEGLPKLPLVVPSVDEIHMEVLSAKAKEKKEKSEKAKSPNAPTQKGLPKPKRANTAYMIFQTKNYQSYKAKHVSSSRAEILKIMKEEWKSLPVEQKSEYIQASADDRIRFESELQAMKTAAAKAQATATTSTQASVKPLKAIHKDLATKAVEKKKRDLENSTAEANSSAVKKRKIEGSVFASWKQS